MKIDNFNKSVLRKRILKRFRGSHPPNLGLPEDPSDEEIVIDGAQVINGIIVISYLVSDHKNHPQYNVFGHFELKILVGEYESLMRIEKINEIING